MSVIFKTTAMADELDWFFEAAIKGEMRVAGDGPTPFCIGSLKTPISCGLSEGYTHQDVAHFYITRELGEDWRLQILKNLNQDFLKRINKAFESFREDADVEIKHVRSLPADVPF